VNAAHTCPTCGATYGSRHGQLNRPDPAAAPAEQRAETRLERIARLQAESDARPGPTG